MSDRRTTLLGVPVDIYAAEELMSELRRALGREGCKTVLATNSEKIMLARRDPSLLRALEGADFLIPDGIGAVIGLRMLRRERVPRITGIDLMKKLMQIAEETGLRVFFFGARPEIVREAVRRASEQHPKLNVVGYENGYVAAAEYGKLIDDINRLQTDILFVALGSPRQEKWLYEHRPQIAARICQGVGGSLDVLSGRLSRAPRWLQRAGLEWLYRFFKEPVRFWRRVVTVVRYAFAVLERLMGSEGPAP